MGLAVLWRVNPSWKQNLFMTGLLWAVGAAAGMVLQLISKAIPHNSRPARLELCGFAEIRQELSVKSHTYWASALLVLALFMPSDNNAATAGSTCRAACPCSPRSLAKFAVILGTADILDHHQREIKSLFQCVFKPACLLIPILVLLRLEPHNSAMLLMA